MTSSENIGAIAPALIKAQSRMQGISKEGNNPAFRSKYVTLDSILDALRPILTANDLMLTQGTTDTTVTDGKVVAITVESRIIHASGEWISTTATIPVTKPDAHGLGSALTYGRRYSVSALLAISADEDDDANGAVTAQVDYRRGPQGNIVIDTPIKAARPLGGNR
jgi:hypothetical protein